MITKRISGQQKQPGSFILQAEPLSRSYHVAESICRIYNRPITIAHFEQSGTGRKTFQQIWMEIPSNLTVSQL